MAKKQGAARTVRAPRTAALPAPTLPGWAPPAIYAAATVLLFREFFLGGTAMLGVDSIALSYFARNFYTEFVQAFHRMPHWNPLLFGGMPFVEGMHGDIFYPPSLAMFFLDARAMWGWKMSLHIFLAGIFTYLWLHRGLRLDRVPAFFGGLVYMMGTELVSLVYPGGDGKLFVSALAPLLFWLAERAITGRRASDYAVLSLGLALLLFTSHMQAAYFCVWGISLYYLFRVWQVWRAERSGAGAAKLVGLFAIAGVLGVAAAAVQFLPPLEYLREHSHRTEKAERGESGYEYSTGYSIHAEEVAALVVPEFVGDLVATSATDQAPGYWGRNPLKLNNEYAGLVPLLLIPILLLRRRTAQVGFFVALAVLALLYALGANTPVFRLFYLIPGVSLFRAPSIIIFLYGFAVATLGALGVQQLQDWLLTGRAEEGATARRALWITAGVFGVLALLASAGALTSVWTAIIHRDIGPMQSQILQANLPYIQLGFWIAFGLVLAVAGLWHLASRGMLTPTAFLFLLAFWAFVDLYRAGRPFVAATALMNEQIASGNGLFRPDDAVQWLQRQRDSGAVFRAFDGGVFPAFMSNVLAIHGLEQLAGHHGNEMVRYRNLIGGERPEPVLDASEFRLMDVTNTEYLMIPQRIADPRFEEVYVGTSAAIYRKRNALPRAYLVGGTEVVPGEAAIERLLAEDFEPRSTAILEEPLPADVEVQPGARGVVEWLERDVDAYVLRVSADRPALLVVLDNWYPAWQATVDGRAVPVLRANYTFRAVPVPPGDHTVSFRYVPADLRMGALISLVVLALLIAVVAGQAVRDRRASHA
ncbi:MAG TPA: YfhO family protein [Longimicrobiales bacterium]